MIEFTHELWQKAGKQIENKVKRGRDVTLSDIGAALGVSPGAVSDPMVFAGDQEAKRQKRINQLKAELAKLEDPDFHEKYKLVDYASAHDEWRLWACPREQSASAHDESISNIFGKDSLFKF